MPPSNKGRPCVQSGLGFFHPWASLEKASKAREQATPAWFEIFLPDRVKKEVTLWLAVVPDAAGQAYSRVICREDSGFRHPRITRSVSR